MKTIQLIENKVLTAHFGRIIYEAIDYQSGYEYAWPWYFDRVEDQWYFTYMDKSTLETNTIPTKVILENGEFL